MKLNLLLSILYGCAIAALAVAVSVVASKGLKASDASHAEPRAYLIQNNGTQAANCFIAPSNHELGKASTTYIISLQPSGQEYDGTGGVVNLPPLSVPPICEFTGVGDADGEITIVPF